MKVGILTFNNTLNFGAVLQAYALQETVISFGHTAEVIDYTNTFIENKEKNNLRLSPYSIIRHFVMGKGLKQKEIAFRRFEEKNMHFGMLLNEESSDKVNAYYDRFITGSDQVWNMTITDSDWTFFLDFVEDDSKKISYAPSFGNDKFPENCYGKTGELLGKFGALSVREESGRKLIKDISGLDAEVVVDPTLLLSKSEWEKRISFVPPVDKYILVYVPHNKKAVFEFVDKLSKRTGLPVVYLSISPRIQPGVKTIYNSAPDEFVGWIKNAEYVVTGSFHGAAFSLNLEKQFYYENTGAGSRIDNIVKLTGTEQRDIATVDLDDVIDYANVRDKLAVQREKSLGWLKASLDK